MATKDISAAFKKKYPHPDLEEKRTFPRYILHSGDYYDYPLANLRMSVVSPGVRFKVSVQNDILARCRQMLLLASIKFFRSVKLFAKVDFKEKDVRDRINGMKAHFLKRTKDIAEFCKSQSDILFKHIVFHVGPGINKYDANRIWIYLNLQYNTWEELECGVILYLLHGFGHLYGCFHHKSEGVMCKDMQEDFFATDDIFDDVSKQILHRTHPFVKVLKQFDVVYFKWVDDMYLEIACDSRITLLSTSREATYAYVVDPAFQERGLIRVKMDDCDFAVVATCQRFVQYISRKTQFSFPWVRRFSLVSDESIDCMVLIRNSVLGEGVKNHLMQDDCERAQDIFVETIHNGTLKELMFYSIRGEFLSQAKNKYSQRVDNTLTDYDKILSKGKAEFAGRTPGLNGHLLTYSEFAKYLTRRNNSHKETCLAYFNF